MYCTTFVSNNEIDWNRVIIYQYSNINFNTDMCIILQFPNNEYFCNTLFALNHKLPEEKEKNIKYWIHLYYYFHVVWIAKSIFRFFINNLCQQHIHKYFFHLNKQSKEFVLAFLFYFILFEKHQKRMLFVCTTVKLNNS